MAGRWSTRGTSTVRIDGFTGRTTELAQLEELLSLADTRIVLLQAMGGMGKTWLARKYFESAESQFQQRAWVHLVNDPSPANCVRQLLSQLQGAPDPTLDVFGLVDLLAERLDPTTLIVLDNFETVLTAASRDEGLLEGFDELIWMIDAHPNARLLVTSREAPPVLEEIGLPHANTFRLAGLDPKSASDVLASRGLQPDGTSLLRLIDKYDGNPQLLRLAAATITALGGDVEGYLDSQSTSSREEADLFEWHVSRVTEDERAVLYWLAILREPCTLAQIQRLRWPRMGGTVIADLLRRLRHGDLVQWVGSDLMTLQPALLAFLTMGLPPFGRHRLSGLLRLVDHQCLEIHWTEIPE